MTKLVVAAVMDFATRGYARPFFAPTWIFAQRGFQDAVNQPDSPTHAHPKDYELHWLAIFDDETGKFEACATPFPVLRAIECVQGATNDASK